MFRSHEKVNEMNELQSSLEGDVPEESTGLSMLDEIIANLKPGGPDTNFELIVHYIDKALDEKTAQQVGRLIVTWRAWYNMYWETVSAMEASLPEVDRI